MFPRLHPNTEQRIMYDIFQNLEYGNLPSCRGYVSVGVRIRMICIDLAAFPGRGRMEDGEWLLLRHPTLPNSHKHQKCIVHPQNGNHDRRMMIIISNPTYHFPRNVITAQLFPSLSVSFSTLVEKLMALMMPSPNFSFKMALYA